MSDEAEDVAYFEAHKDDPDEWGDPLPGPGKPRRRLASMISVRLTPDEVDKVRAAAARQGLSVSAFLRAAALKESAGNEAGSSEGLSATLVVGSGLAVSVAVNLLSAPTQGGFENRVGFAGTAPVTEAA